MVPPRENTVVRVWGLSITRQFVEMMGGEIRVESPWNCRLMIEDCRLKNDKSEIQNNRQADFASRLRRSGYEGREVAQTTTAESPIANHKSSVADRQSKANQQSSIINRQSKGGPAVFSISRSALN